MSMPEPVMSARRQLLVDLARLKHEAGSLGMYRTMHKVDEAANVAGWELVEILQRDDPGRPRETSGA